ncbi:MAG TPA: PAS domain S-box protein [Leptolinea sp.]
MANNSLFTKQKIGAFFRSMRGKIVIVCVSMVMAVAIIIGALTYFQSLITLQTLTSSSLKQSSTLIAANVTASLQNNLAFVRTVAGSQIAQSMNPDIITPYLKEVNQEYKMFTGFYAVGMDGKTIASSTGITMNVADRIYFKQMMQGQANISDPVVARDTGLIVIVFSAPIRKDGVIIGGIIAANTTQYWDNLMAAAQSGGTDETYLINQAGLFLTPSRFTDQLKTAGIIKTRSELELVDGSLGAKEALAGQSGIREFTNYRGRDVLGAYQPVQVENIHWGLMSMIEKDEVYAPINRLGIMIIITTGIVTLIFILLALITARNLTHPLTAVADAARRIALGDINQEVKVINHDEVGVVAEAFQTMIRYLNELVTAAERLANGDLTNVITPKSDKDVFGKAFVKMVTNLQEHMRNLEDERALLQAFMDNIPDAIYFKDTESHFIRINKTEANRFGLSDPAQAIGMSDFDYYSEHHARPAYEDEQEIMRSGQPLINKEEEKTWPDGSAGWVSTTKMPLRDGAGQIIGTFGISRDITELKRVQDELLTNQERMNLVLDSGNIGIFDMNLITDTTWRTLKHDQIFGFDSLQPEWKFENFLQRVLPEDRKLVTEGLGKILEVQGAFVMSAVYFECRIERIDTEQRWISLQVSIFRDETGKPIRCLGAIIDITEKKIGELSLQKRVMELETVNKLTSQLRADETLHDMLQKLLDETLKTINSKDGGIFLFDPSSNHLELSICSGWFDNLGDLIYETGEGINGHVFSTNQPYLSSEMQNDPLLAKKIQKLIPTQQSGGFFPIQSSEGTLGVLDVFVPLPRKISDDEQRLLTIISQLAGNAILRTRLNEKLKLSNIDLLKEIEQRNVFQEMLAAEKDLLTTTLMSIGEGVIVTDKDGLIVLFNSATESITGYDALEVIDQPLHHVFQIIDPNTQQVNSDIITSLYKMNRVQENDSINKAPVLITRSGERILISGSISGLKSSKGETMGHVIVFQNITEKLKAEASIALSQKMGAIGQLAAGIAHEINTPIQYVGDNLRFLQKTVIKFTEILDAFINLTSEPDKLLRQEEIDQLEEFIKQKKIQHYFSESPSAIQEALDGVERVRKIVLAMREFSHPSEKEKKYADINHGIETTIVISRSEWKYCAELETDLEPELPLVNCQIDEINQVFLNMIINAAQSIQEKIPEGSDQKGKISIRTWKDDNKVLITIQDTGKGIPEEIQMRIFDPFFTTKGIGKGTGQGLSMAHNIIVNKHQGKIRVASIVGQGTTFTIELPIDPLIQVS